jgi:hypothetical protein
MPAAKVISLNEKDWIKQYLQETYSVTVVDAFDCATLSDAILKSKGKTISCSTSMSLS